MMNDKTTYTITEIKKTIDQMCEQLVLKGMDPGNTLILRAKDCHSWLDKISDKLRISDNDITENNHLNSDLPEKLHNMSLDQVCALNLSDFNSPDLIHHTEDELVEAAFRFENELMALLGDMNTIPFDTYVGLDKKKLINIIQESVDKLAKYQNT